jgi:hypothetical protein
MKRYVINRNNRYCCIQYPHSGHIGCGCQCVGEGLENGIPFLSPSLNIDVMSNSMIKLRIIFDKNFFFQTPSQINDAMKKI